MDRKNIPENFYDEIIRQAYKDYGDLESAALIYSESKDPYHLLNAAAIFIEEKRYESSRNVIDRAKNIIQFYIDDIGPYVRKIGFNGTKKLKTSEITTRWNNHENALLIKDALLKLEEMIN